MPFLRADRNVFLSFVVAAVLFTSTELFAQSSILQYKAPAEPVYYRIKITVDSPSAMTTYTGQTIYEGIAGKSGEDKVTLKFSGRLHQSVKSKSRGRRPGPPRGFGGPPRGFGFRFGPGSKTTALQHTESRITITRAGDVLSLTGESQIPIPLGHLSILVFDSLPTSAKEEWSTDSGVVLGQERDDYRRIPRPFGPGANSDKTSAGSETAKYRITSRDGDRATIEKTYELDSPNSDPPFTFGGTGTITFDSKVGMFASASLKYVLKLSSKNVEVRIPVTIDYNTMTAAEVEADAKKKQELAEAALEKGMAAARDRFKDKTEEQIAEIYRKGGQVPPTGVIMTPEMKIPVGLIAQNKWPTEYRWSALKVIQVLPNNLIKFQSMESKRFYTRNRNTLSLAPDFVEQPHVSEADLELLKESMTPSEN